MAKTIRTKKLELDLDGMGSPKTWGLINAFAGKGKTYLEVGSYRGASLIAAAHNNPDTHCIGIDNFKTFNPENKNEDICRENISKYENIEIVKSDFQKEIPNMIKAGVDVDCFFYDGPHDRVNMSLALEYALDLINEGGYIIIDDTDWDYVEDAVKDFCKEFGWEVILKRKAKFQGDVKTWWNGICVLKRKGE